MECFEFTIHQQYHRKSILRPQDAKTIFYYLETVIVLTSSQAGTRRGHAWVGALDLKV